MHAIYGRALQVSLPPSSPGQGQSNTQLAGIACGEHQFESISGIASSEGHESMSVVAQQTMRWGMALPLGFCHMHMQLRPHTVSGTHLLTDAASTVRTCCGTEQGPWDRLRPHTADHWMPVPCNVCIESAHAIRSARFGGRIPAIASPSLFEL